MNIKQKIRNSVVALLVFVPVFAVALPAGSVNAAGNKGCEVDTAIISCDNVDTDADGIQNTGLWSILLTVIDIMVAGVGVLALAGIVYGSVLYTSAGGNPEQVKKARTIFLNVGIGVVSFAGMWALLNFIVPGGAFNLL